ncbi:helix-turn-helix domain-containing protein [Flavihumibacter sp. UBA7668]|uniref:helix-turn-helix domain-containing protein n=1 Tax=Flavihumibacter sp. UBA7668 TaxID=1946542 RepID=UPI0025C2EA00|nr:helix-turn-helix domain-containing protein [Flavihumibacter sp. UBA7668]
MLSPGSIFFGVCFKPAAFANFYKYADLNELTNSTIELEQSISLPKDELINSPFSYFNQYYIDRIRNKDVPLHSVITDIHNSNGRLSIYELSKRNYITTRQLERYFKSHIGMSPKEYSNIVRFQKALSEIRNLTNKRSLSDIAVDCGFYDRSHLTNEIKRNTGISPSQL